MKKVNYSLTLCLLLLLLSPLALLAQKEANTWYFGVNAGLDFNNIVAGKPTVLTNGALNTQEGCSSMSDKNTGQLLFYTNGIAIWNANHDTMMNGDSLWGDKSSSQGALIVPQPGTCNRYYVFTTYNQGFMIGGIVSPFAYSIVDMNLDNGLGAVIEKNTVLLDSAVEKIAAVKHVNACDIWVLTHKLGSNDFYSFLLSNSGIIDTVISSIGDTTFAGMFNNTNGLSMGHMKFSPDGAKLVYCYLNNLRFIPGPVDTVVSSQVFDFNNSNGLVSNPVDLDVLMAYGASFSPNSSLLYVTGLVIGGKTLIQYDLSASDINASRVDIIPNPALNGEVQLDLQLAPDEKIYVNYGKLVDTLGVIDNPNTIGIGCNYIRQGVYLGGRQTYEGLPDFVESYLNPNYIAPSYIAQADFSFNDDCLRDTTRFTDESTISQSCIAPISWKWTFGDPASGSADTSFLQQPVHYYADTGTYEVTLIVQNECVYDTSVQYVTIDSAFVIVSVAKDTTICLGQNMQLIASVSGQPNGNINYSWNPLAGLSQDGIANPIADPDATTIYKLTVSDDCNSMDSTFVTITVNSLPVIAVSDDTTICKGDSIMIYATGGDLYLWSPSISIDNTALSNPTVNPDNAITYFVSVMDTATQCSSTDSVAITIAPVFVDLGEDTFICQGEIIELNTGANIFDSYLWSTGGSTASISVTEPGTYWLNATLNQCPESDTIIIGECPAIYIPNAFSPNEDGFNDGFKIRKEGFKLISLIIYDRWGHKVFDGNASNDTWLPTQNNSGVYVYQYELEADDNGKFIEGKGNVMLIR